MVEREISWCNTSPQCHMVLFAKLKEEKKNTEPWRQQRFGLQDHCDTQSMRKPEKREKNQIRNETKRKKKPSFRKYTVWKVHEAMTIYYIWTAERFDRAPEVLAWVCLCTNIQLKAINSSGNNKIVILKQKKRWNISKENILGFSNIRW